MTDRSKERRNVLLLCGGRSSEHEISLRSAATVWRAISRSRYEVQVAFIDRSGGWWAVADPEALFRTGRLSEKAPRMEAFFPADTRPGGFHLVGERDERWQPDLVFPVLHGPGGEDGSVQGLLELLSLPFVGCGVMSSAVAMDKITTKQLCAAHGIPVVEYLAVTQREWRRSPTGVAAEVEAELGFPCFVKPANLGSSVGVSKVIRPEDFPAAMEEAVRYDRRILIERAVEAREIELSVLGNEEPIVSVPGEIRPSGDFYDYNTKYIDTRSELIIPADLPADQIALIQRHALRAYRLLDCAGMARVDFLLDRSTSSVYLNEINTIPGFTSISMYPKLWEASGIALETLLDRLFEASLERWEERVGNSVAPGRPLGHPSP